MLLEHGANPNAGLDGCQHCVNITRVYHGKQAKPLERLLRRQGAYTQPQNWEEFKKLVDKFHPQYKELPPYDQLEQAGATTG